MPITARMTASAVLACVLLAACSSTPGRQNPAPSPKEARAQLSIGYTLLYQEWSAIPKLKWLLMFKDKPGDVGHLLDDVVDCYQQLSSTLEKLSEQYPAVHLDVVAMSSIETDARKALGEDHAKDFAPLVGKNGRDFEREALLLFYDALDEQRHIIGVMLDREMSPGLRQFLETAKSQLDERHGKVGALLNRRYFTH